jgi:hypothetical protein
MTYMANFCKIGAVVAVAMVSLAPAHAAYVLSNSTDADGYVYGGPAGYTFTLVGADDDVGFTDTEYTATAASAATISGKWLYQTFDCCGAFWDPAGYIINGVKTQLSDDSGGPGVGGSGVFSFSVSPGDVYGFYVDSQDSVAGRGALSIGSVPEPASWALMIAGFSFVGFAMRGQANRRRSVAV